MGSRLTLLRQAGERRRGLAAQGTTCYRLFQGAAEGSPGVTVDLFEDVAVASFYDVTEAENERAWVEDIAQVTQARAVYVKRRPKEARVVANTRKASVAPDLPAWGEPVESVWVRENGLGFLIRPAQGLSVGLYLDTREARAFLRARVARQSVLNLFAYTCAFGVYARAGGARSVVNVDLSRRVLDWGAENLRRNGFDPSPDECTTADARGWAKGASKRDRRFDWVVLDPPSFAQGRQGAFSAERDYPDLVARTAPLVAPGGALVACANLARLPPQRFRAKVESGLVKADRRGKLEAHMGPPAIDFPVAPQAPAALKVFIYRLD